MSFFLFASLLRLLLNNNNNTHSLSLSLSLFLSPFLLAAMQHNNQQQQQEGHFTDLSLVPLQPEMPPPDPPRRPQRRSRRRSSVLRTQQLRVYEQQRQEQQSSQLETRVARVTDFDRAYFDCYAHIGVHEEMIKDRVRTDTYRNAIMFHHHHLIAGKVVLDVGCGTGILSIFCAQAGAKRVYAVEASNIALQAKSVVEANGLSNIVNVLHGQVEDIEINEKVDVIVSEWMGYMLLYESMLRSVITARDRWLKPGGLILPSIATLYMAPVTHSRRYGESVDFWRNVYGIDMSVMMPLAKQCAFEEPSVETISGENVLTWPHVVKRIDCYSVTIPELVSITTWFQFKSRMRAPLHGFAFWFDVEFTERVQAPLPISYLLSNSSVDNHQSNGSQSRTRDNRDRTLVLSTAPEAPPTHWQQTVIYYYDPIEVQQHQLIEGSVTLSQSQENARFMNIRIAYTSDGHSYVKETVLK